MRGDELPHDVNADGVLKNFQFNTLRANVFFRPFESYVFAYDDAGNFIKQRRSAAHRAGRLSGIQRATPIIRRLLPSGVFQAIHLRMMNDTALLDALIM